MHEAATDSRGVVLDHTGALISDSKIEVSAAGLDYAQGILLGSGSFAQITDSQFIASSATTNYADHQTAFGNTISRASEFTALPPGVAGSWAVYIFGEADATFEASMLNGDIYSNFPPTLRCLQSYSPAGDLPTTCM